MTTTRPQAAARFPPAIVVLLFFLSGTCGLVYQIVWIRMLLPVFGASVPAVTTVLTAFMAGLALGAARFGRLSDRHRSGLLVYAWLELGIALSAACLPIALAGLDPLHTWLYRHLGGSPLAFTASRFLLSAALLLIPTTLMGGTLPALVRYVWRAGGRLGWTVGALYGMNTLGAMTGCVLAAFVLIESLGAARTNWAVAAVNLLIAALALFLGRRGPIESPEPPEERAALETDRPAPALVHVVFWGYAVSGFAALGFEVLWARLLSVILRITTTQSLSTILVVFLFGLGSGSALAARWIDRIRRLPAAFGILEIGLGLAGMLSIAAFGLVPEIARALGGIVGWPGHLLRLLAAASAVMLVPTFLMGLLFPVAGKLYAAGHADLGRRMGGIYAANTVGAIGGASVTGFVLLPLLGSQRSLVALAALNLAVGASTLFVGREAGRPRRLALPAALALTALAVPLLLPRSFLVERFRQGGRAEMVYYREGAAGTVTLHRMEGGIRMLRVNGAGEVPTDWPSVRIFRLLGTLPFVLHPNARDVLVIAYGGGITLASVEDQEPASIDCVEIASGVVEASRGLADLNDAVFERVAGGRIRMVFDDGRNHVRRTTRRYDVILSDSTHPATADSWVLYTEEFYRQSRARLRDGGVFAQWLPVHGLTADDYRIILRTFRRAFPHATLWYSRGYSVLVGTPERLRVDYATVAARLGLESARQPLAEVDLADPTAFLATLALDEDGLASYAGAGPTNTDDRALISFRDRTREGTIGPIIVAGFLPFTTRGGLRWLEGGSVKERDALERRIDASALTMRAEVESVRGDRTATTAALSQALKLAPEDETARRAWAAVQAAAPR